MALPVTHRKTEEKLLKGRGGGGAKSYDSENAWSPINHSILSAPSVPNNLCHQFALHCPEAVNAYYSFTFPTLVNHLFALSVLVLGCCGTFETDVKDVKDNDPKSSSTFNERTKNSCPPDQR